MKYKFKKYMFIIFKNFYLNIIVFIVNYILPISFMRGKIYNLLHPNFIFEKGVKLRKNISFYGGSELNGKLYVGNNSFINEECFIDYSSEVRIGKNVAIGMRTLILSSSHKIGAEVRCGLTLKKITIIEDNCWIGAGAIIYPGVTIFSGSIISAGEIVRKNIPGNKILKDGKLVNIIIKGINE